MQIENVFEAGVIAQGRLRNPDIPYDVHTVLTADGASLHVRSYGRIDAPIVVLVHGFCARIEYWNPQINDLAERYRVVTYDQRGLGRSTFGSRPFHPDVLGDDLSAVLAAVIPARRTAVLVGHSYGGISIMSWAKRHGSEVATFASAVLLADTVAERFNAYTAAVPFAGSFAAVRRPLLTTVSRSRVRMVRAPFVRAVFRRFVLTPAAPSEQVGFLMEMVLGVAPAIRSPWAAGLSKLDVVGGLANIDVPTTVLVGAIDRLTPPPASHQIADALESRSALYRYVEIEGAGHCTNIEAPAEFDAEIDALVALGHARPSVVGQA